LVKKITSNTKAIFVSPVLGNPPDMDRLVEIAKTHNLKGAKDKVYYSGPLMDEDELTEAIDSLLFGKWFVSGEKVYQFEREFSKTVNQKYSVMVNSGSSANLVMIASLKQYLMNW